MTGSIRIFEEKKFYHKTNKAKLPDMIEGLKSSQVYNESQALPLIVIS